MMMIGTLNTLAASIQRSQKQVDEIATRISRGSDDFTGDIVQLRAAQNQFMASVVAFKISDDMMKTLIETLGRDNCCRH